MKKNNYLYTSFLKDKRVYNLNRAYWKRIFDSITEQERMPYKFSYINGRQFYDGNPIAATYAPKLRKSVRIIQEEIETEGVEIGAWIEGVELENQEVMELVISLELSKEAANIAKQLIEGWLKQEWGKQEVDLLLEEALKYQK